MQQDLPLFPERASTISDRIDALYFFLVGTSLFFATLVTVLVVVFAIRYRRSRNVKCVGSRFCGHDRRGPDVRGGGER